MSRPRESHCVLCGAPLYQRSGAGRPRIYCPQCYLESQRARKRGVPPKRREYTPPIVYSSPSGESCIVCKTDTGRIITRGRCAGGCRKDHP